MTERRIVKAMLLIALLISMAGVIFIILAYSTYYFHSDCAGYLFLAKEQLAQKRMFPEGFEYTTDIFFLTPSVTMIPFLAILDNELLVHELGILFYIAVICVLVFQLFWDKRKAAVIVVTFFLFPLSWVVIDMFFSQGAYLTSCLFKTVLLIAVRYVFQCERKGSFKKLGTALGCYLIIGFLVNFAVIRGIATDMLPILFAFAAMILLREGISVEGALKQKKLLLYSVCTIVIIAGAGIHYVRLCNKLGYESPSLSIGLSDSEAFCQNISKMPSLVLSLMGWTATESLFSITTIRSCALLVYIIVSQIAIPLYLLTKVNRISDKFMQFVVLFVNLSNFITVFVMVGSGQMESRYYLPVYFNNLLLWGLMGKWFLDEWYDKLKMIPAVVALSITICVHGLYIQGVPDQWKQNVNLFHPKADMEHQNFYNFLLDRGLTYGYATFWNAYPITVLSNEEIIVVAHDAESPTVPYFFNENTTQPYRYYAISKEYYDVELHSGRCFVLVLAGETIPEAYYQLAEEILMYEGFTILVYEKNIHEYPQLAAAQ